MPDWLGYETRRANPKLPPSPKRGIVDERQPQQQVGARAGVAFLPFKQAKRAAAGAEAGASKKKKKKKKKTGGFSVAEARALNVQRRKEGRTTKV